MPERRAADDPWYTALYKEPRSIWWGPAVAVFVIWVAVGLLMQRNSTRDALVQAAALSAGPLLLSYVYWRRKRT